MRSILLGAAAALFFTTSAASAQYPAIGPDNYLLNGPVAQPWNVGGYDPRLGYWIHGGIPDKAGEMWAVRAYTPISANGGYWLSHPPGTGYVMGYPPAPAVVATAPVVVAAPAALSRWHPCRR